MPCNLIRHFALHTLYLTLYPRYSKLRTRTPYSTVQIGDSRLWTLHSHSTLRSALCTLHSVLCTLRCPLPIGHFTLHNLNSTRIICFRWFTWHVTPCLHSSLMLCLGFPHFYHYLWYFPIKYKMRSSLPTPNSTPYTFYSILYTSHLALPTQSPTQHSPHYSLHFAHHILHWTPHCACHRLQWRGNRGKTCNFSCFVFFFLCDVHSGAWSGSGFGSAICMPSTVWLFFCFPAWFCGFCGFLVYLGLFYLIYRINLFNRSNLSSLSNLSNLFNLSSISNLSNLPNLSNLIYLILSSEPIF